MRILIAGLALVLITEARGCNSQQNAKPNASVQVNAVVHFPDRPAAQIRGANIEFCSIDIPGSGPGRPMNLNLYLPAGRHEAHSLPCVLIAPAGSANHGSVIADNDRPEHLPYVRAGFAVVCYELSGALTNPSKRSHTYAEVKGPITQFMEAQGGVVNGQIAIDYVLAKVPEVSPEQLYACGHSSAAVVALDLAVADSRIRGCCAYAPLTDVETWWRDAKMERYVPGYDAFSAAHSPRHQVAHFNCPVLLFHADDDSMVPLADNQAFSDAMKAAGKKITFSRVASGDHYESMIKEGIPQGIAFMEANGAHPLKPLPKTDR